MDTNLEQYRQELVYIAASVGAFPALRSRYSSDRRPTKPARKAYAS